MNAGNCERHRRSAQVAGAKQCSRNEELLHVEPGLPDLIALGRRTTQRGLLVANVTTSV